MGEVLARAMSSADARPSYAYIHSERAFPSGVLPKTLFTNASESFCSFSVSDSDESSVMASWTVAPEVPARSDASATVCSRREPGLGTSEAGGISLVCKSHEYETAQLGTRQGGTLNCDKDEGCVRRTEDDVDFGCRYPVNQTRISDKFLSLFLLSIHRCEITSGGQAGDGEGYR